MTGTKPKDGERRGEILNERIEKNIGLREVYVCPSKKWRHSRTTKQRGWPVKRGITGGTREKTSRQKRKEVGQKVARCN